MLAIFIAGLSALHQLRRLCEHWSRSVVLPAPHGAAHLSRYPFFVMLALLTLAPAIARAQPVAWTQLNPIVHPDWRAARSMVYDSARGVAVLFGGSSNSRDTWEWDGATWSLRATTGPASNTGEDMAYDSARGVTVLFGRSANGAQSETWEWNGSVWTLRFVGGPSPRIGHAIEYDPVRGVTLLFGGRSSSQVYNNETWEWNGTTWTQRMAGGPSPRFVHNMVFDTARAVIVLFGGYANDMSLGGTWEWNGSGWTLRSNSGPTPRNGFGLAYDQRRGVTVLFGGFRSSLNTINAETWEWNGAAWTQLPISGPGPRQLAGMVYHAASGVFLLFGGLSFNSSLDDTWILRCASTTIRTQPQPAAVCSLTSAIFSVSAGAPEPISYAWQIQTSPDDWQILTAVPMPLPCGGMASATPPDAASTSVTVSPCSGTNTYSIRVLVSTPSCPITSNPTTLTFVQFPSTDLNGDGFRNSQDYFIYTCEFLGSCPPSPATDFNQDGQINTQDFFDFLAAFFAGC